MWGRDDSLLACGEALLGLTDHERAVTVTDRGFEKGRD